MGPSVSVLAAHAAPDTVPEWERSTDEETSDFGPMGFGVLTFATSEIKFHSDVNRKFLACCWMCCSRMFAGTHVYYIAVNVAEICHISCLGFEVPVP